MYASEYLTFLYDLRAALAARVVDFGVELLARYEIAISFLDYLIFGFNQLVLDLLEFTRL